MFIAQAEFDFFSSKFISHGEIVHTENNNGTNSVVRRSVIEFKGNEVSIDPNIMTIGIPYVFPFGGGYALVIKREDGGVDFYAVES